MKTLSNPTHTAIEFTLYTATDKDGRVWGEGRSKEEARNAARSRMRVEGVAGPTMRALALDVTEKK